MITTTTAHVRIFSRQWVVQNDDDTLNCVVKKMSNSSMTSSICKANSQILMKRKSEHKSVAAFVCLSLFFWILHYLPFLLAIVLSPFSFGYCIICLFSFGYCIISLFFWLLYYLPFLLAIVLFVSFLLVILSPSRRSLIKSR
jgi:cellulose synthase/poly-beta-1,6-N-acetylglucosamine synthase-like glycosyltransferase